MESEYLSNMLYDSYRHSGDDYKKAININEKRLCKEYQLRICHAYKYVIRLDKRIVLIGKNFLSSSFWMKTFPMHFDLDKRLKETCEKMKHLIESTGDIECMKLVDPSQVYVNLFGGGDHYEKCLLFYFFFSDPHLIGCVK